MIPKPLSPDLFQRIHALRRRLVAAELSETRRPLRLCEEMAHLEREQALLMQESELLKRAERVQAVPQAMFDSLRARMESLGERIELLRENANANWFPSSIPEADEILVAIAEHYEASLEQTRKGRLVCASLKRLIGWIDARRTLNRTPHHDAVLRCILENAMLGEGDVFPERLYSLQVPAL